MTAVRCTTCQRRFTVGAGCESQPCPFCGGTPLILSDEVPPARTLPPAIERLALTEQTNAIARRLVESALGGG